MIKAQVTKKEVLSSFDYVFPVQDGAARFLLNHESPRYYVASRASG